METLNDFDNGEIRILVATELGSRGLDFSVDHVINYDFPLNALSLLHSFGRTARVGKFGKGIN